MKSTRTFSRFGVLFAGLLTVGMTGCTVTGVGSIPSAVEGSNQDMTFTADFAYNNDQETITGTASFEDCAASVSVLASFSTENLNECLEAFNESEIGDIEDALGASLEECLGLEDILSEINQEQIAYIFGRYELVDDCKPGKRLGHTKGKGHQDHGNGNGNGHDKNHSHSGNGGDGDGDVIGTGCLFALYVDCEIEGCLGDALAVILIDDSDPTNVFYSNCGVLNSGDIEIVYDTGTE